MLNKPRVTITGISGFVGSAICHHLLKSGQFTVRGTVRNAKDEAKLAPLKNAFGSLFDQLEIAQAELSDADSVSSAIAGS